MTNNPNELTIENSVLVLIDHQPWVAFAVTSIDRGVTTTSLASHRRRGIWSRSLLGMAAAAAIALTPISYSRSRASGSPPRRPRRNSEGAVAP
jgi:hypothetical protein